MLESTQFYKRRECTLMDDSTIHWTKLAVELDEHRNFWLTTVNLDNTPHVAPIWGVVLEDRFLFYTSRVSRKARNIIRQPHVGLHLESAENVLIVYGKATDEGLPQHHPDVLTALEQKYEQPGDHDYLPSSDTSYDVLFSLNPTSALGWRLDDFEGSQIRWARKGNR